jgi:hypothetical protein
MDARLRAAGRRRRDRRGFVALAVAVFVAAAALAASPALHEAWSRYLARGGSGAGEAVAGDHLQLAWALWLPGHQVERGDAPWADPYSFRPEAEAPPNVLGYPLGLPYWPLDRLLGHVPAYNLVLLLALAASGLLACWWLRALDLSRGAAVVGGLAYALAPYLLAQAAAGHLLGFVAALLPAMLLALERRRFVVAAALLASIPLSGQLHLALGAIPLYLGYAWARLERRNLREAGLGAAAGATAGLWVWALTVRGSIAGEGRSLESVERYQAEVRDFLDRSVDAQLEEFVYLGLLLPVLALVGFVLLVRERRFRLASVLGVAVLVPCVLALGTNLPVYEPLWHAFPPLRFPRVPERLLPIACLALATLAALAVARLRRTAVVVVVALLLVADLRVSAFRATDADAGSAYAALRGDGRLLELPVFRPGQHWGGVYLAYVRRSPRERPQGYSTVAEPAADRWAVEHAGLSCGRGRVPAGIRFVAVHRGLYQQSGLFAESCPGRAEAMLERTGWRLLRREGAIVLYERPAPALGR